MSKSLEAIGNECIYIEDELGIVLVNLTETELRLLARISTELAELSEGARDAIFDELADRLDHEGSISKNSRDDLDIH